MRMLKIVRDITTERRSSFIEDQKILFIPLNKLNYVASSENVSRIDTDEISVRINVGADQIQEFIKNNLTDEF